MTMQSDPSKLSVKARWNEFSNALDLCPESELYEHLKTTFYSGCLAMMLDIKSIAENGNVEDFQGIFERYRTEINSELGSADQ